MRIRIGSYNKQQTLNSESETTFKIFEEAAFSKFAEGMFTGIFDLTDDIMSYYFSDRQIGAAALLEKGSVVEAFKELCTKDGEFLRSLETSTKNIEPTAKRFGAWGKKLRQITSLEFPVPVRAQVGFALE